MSTRRSVISLYRSMLREAEKMPTYNFRMYACRKIRDTFRENRSLKDFSEIDKHIEIAKKNLEIIRRQVIIGHLYSVDKLVIEKKKTLNSSDD